jgi:hypothetical protein
MADGRLFHCSPGHDGRRHVGCRARDAECLSPLQGTSVPTTPLVERHPLAPRRCVRRSLPPLPCGARGAALPSREWTALAARARGKADSTTSKGVMVFAHTQWLALAALTYLIAINGLRPAAISPSTASDDAGESVCAMRRRAAPGPGPPLRPPERLREWRLPRRAESGTRSTRRRRSARTSGRRTTRLGTGATARRASGLAAGRPVASEREARTTGGLARLLAASRDLWSSARPR